ncbi:MAG: NAD(P)/FAD-dependent oxidoreductase [bacterium]
MTQQKTPPTVIIGAGASGFFAAIQRKKTAPNQDIIILEKSSNVLEKVLLSGGGRCNVTHACYDPQTLCSYYPRGNKALRSVFERFDCQDTLKWFEKHGVKLKTEADGRIFPVSNQAQDIKNCLLSTAKKLGIKIWTNYPITSIKNVDHTFVINSQKHSPLLAQQLILATGSNRSGYKLAQDCGLKLIPPIPSLFSFKTDDTQLQSRQGLSVQHSSITLNLAPKQPSNGPILITHWGLSGPAIITLSAWQAQTLYKHRYQAMCKINWLVKYPQETILKTLLTNKDIHKNKRCTSLSPFKEIPLRLWEYFCQKINLDPSQTWQTLQKKQLYKLLDILTQQQLSITGKGPFKEEFVTCGGVDQKAINFKTMASKHNPNLFVIGELLDCDGVTGGFNFQQAWATGWIAGNAAYL